MSVNPTDITLLWTTIGTVAAAPAAYLANYAIYKAGRLLKLKGNSQVQDDLDQALEHGFNLAVDWFKSVEAHNGYVQIPNSKLADIAATVLKMAPAAEATLGVTPTEIGTMVQGKLSTWLHWSMKPDTPSTVVNVAPPATPVEPAAAPAAA
jgi:hypothetical protein